MKVSSILAAAAIMSAAALSQAALLTVTNPSFETPVEAVGLYTNQDAGSSWVSLTTLSNSNAWGVRKPAAGEVTSGFDGSQFMYLLSYGATQTLSDVVTVGNTYTLTVAVGHRSSAVKPTTINYTIELLAGSTILNSYTANTSAIADASFADKTVTYTSPTGDLNAGQPLKILIQSNLTANDSNSDLAFDNVRLDATGVPEPTSLALLGLGSLALLKRRRA